MMFAKIPQDIRYSGQRTGQGKAARMVFRAAR